MKKIYLEPTAKLVKVELESMVLAGSPMFGEISGDSTTTQGGKEDEDFGW